MKVLTNLKLRCIIMSVEENKNNFMKKNLIDKATEYLT